MPILIGGDEAAIAVADELFDAGIFAPCVRWPAVPKNRSIIRVTMTALHTKEQIEEFVEVLVELGREHGII